MSNHVTDLRISSPNSFRRLSASASTALAGDSGMTSEAEKLAPPGAEKDSGRRAGGLWHSDTLPPVI